MIDRARARALCINPEYDFRFDPSHFDDRDMRDQWQDAVYDHALGLVTRQCLRRVVDFGCGSGFKLMKYFSGYDTIGYEIEPSLSYLVETYPDRRWKQNWPPQFIGDIFICADVLEHMRDPCRLLRRLSSSSIRYILLSTPALDILCDQGRSPRLGPPDNTSHLNEWTTLEFRSYVEQFLRVVSHTVTNAEQATQLIVARVK